MDNNHNHKKTTNTTYEPCVEKSPSVNIRLNIVKKKSVTKITWRDGYHNTHKVGEKGISHLLGIVTIIALPSFIFLLIYTIIVDGVEPTDEYIRLFLFI